MVVDRRHLEPTAEEARHHGGDLLVEQHEIAHDHRLIAHLLERGVRAERESRLHGHALDRHREIGARHSDSKDVTVLELARLAERLLDGFPGGLRGGHGRRRADRAGDGTDEDREREIRDSHGWDLLLRAIAVDGGPMARRQEHADDVARGVERERMRAGFRDDGLVTPQRRRVEDLDEAGVADRDVQPLQRRIEEHDVGSTGDRFGREERAAVRVRLEQHARVARAEEPAAHDVEVKTTSGSATSAPATAVRPGMEPTYFCASMSMTSTASFAVWAT